MHHYLICYNIKIPAWEIIDNNVADNDGLDKYGSLPFDLVSCSKQSKLKILSVELFMCFKWECITAQDVCVMDERAENSKLDGI